MAMDKMVAGMFDSLSDAHEALLELESSGFLTNQVSLVMKDPRFPDRPIADEIGQASSEGSGDPTGTAAAGALIGAGVGFLAGVSALIMPIFGPLIFLGALGTGAAIGGGAGALMGAIDQAS